MIKKILIADDDTSSAGFLLNVTLGNGFEATGLSDIPEKEALSFAISKTTPDIVILGGGYREFSEFAAEALGKDNVYLLENGDDEHYLGCPVNLTRLTQLIEDTAGKESFRHMGLSVDLNKCIVKTSSGEFTVSRSEMEILCCFMRNPNRVFSSQQLAYEVFGTDASDNERKIDSAVSSLKARLEGVHSNWNLKTLWGVGYKFEVVDNPELLLNKPADTL